MMKHILETKHEEKNFRCAVIVNDMAALNIDKSLIDQSALVQSDEVIAMQNGCFCCTLQSDLVDQIIALTEKKLFNYMLIEASGVSEPSQIAPLFDLCDMNMTLTTQRPTMTTARSRSWGRWPGSTPASLLLIPPTFTTISAV